MHAFSPFFYIQAVNAWIGEIVFHETKLCQRHVLRNWRSYIHIIAVGFVLNLLFLSAGGKNIGTIMKWKHYKYIFLNGKTFGISPLLWTMCGLTSVISIYVEMSSLMIRIFLAFCWQSHDKGKSECIEISKLMTFGNGF